jgi:uncharacterized protein
MQATQGAFDTRSCRWVKPVDITFTLTLMIAPAISGCESDKVATESADRTPAITSQHRDETTSSADDAVTCLKTWKDVDEMAYQAVDQSNFDRALNIWRQSARDGNQLSELSLCLFHMSQSTPVRYRDYDEAFDICSSLAVGGFSSMQYILAKMYGAGVGVEKDKSTALYWFNQAAQGGDETSQYITGLAYLTGNGLPKDFVLAYKWLNVAAGNGVEKAVEARDVAASLLTRSELSEAQKLTRDYEPRLPQGHDFEKDCSKWLAQGQKSY